MDKKDIIEKILIIIFFLLFLVILSGNIKNSFIQGEKAGSIVPLFGLRFDTHLFIFTVLWPVLMSIVFIVVFPIIFVPILMKLKGVVWYKFENGFLDIGKLSFKPGKFLKRGIFLVLLTMGVNAAILGLGVFDPNVLLPGKIYGDTEAQRRAFENYPLFYPEVFFSFAYMIFPFIVGIWSIGWALEDSGLMHYKLPNGNEKYLYEIEPVHLKYNGVVKGYAGISAILYVISAITFYINIDYENINTFISMVILMMFLMVPAYIFYLIIIEKVYKKRFRKGLEEVKLIRKEDFKTK